MKVEVMRKPIGQSLLKNRKQQEKWDNLGKMNTWDLEHGKSVGNAELMLSSVPL